MAEGGTSVRLRVRAQELESLLQGVPKEVLAATVEHALGLLDEAGRTAARARLRACKTRAEGTRELLAAIAQLDAAAQDEVAAATLEAAAQASLGSDD